MKGAVLHQQNTCYLLLTIFLAASFLLPLFLVCTEWWRNRVLMLSGLGEDVYRLIRQLLEWKEFEEVFLCVEDSFLSQLKMDILLEGLRRSKTKSFVFQNKAKNIDVHEANASQFTQYCTPFMQSIENSELRWGNAVLSNVLREGARL